MTYLGDGFVPLAHAEMLSVSLQNNNNCDSPPPKLPAFKDILNLSSINEHLSTRSYINGHAPTEDDEIVLHMLGDKNFDEEFIHVCRWKSHILSFSVHERKSWKGQGFFFVNGDGCGGCGAISKQSCKVG